MRAHLSFVFVVMLLHTTSIFAQPTGYSAGMSIGTLIYQGDLTPKYYGYTKQLKPAFGIHIEHTLGSVISIRTSLLYGQIMADESKYSNPEFRQYRNFKFSSTLAEFSSLLLFRPFENNSRNFSPYLFAGGGITFLHVKRDWSGFKTDYFNKQGIAALSLQADSLHSLPRFIPVLPVGAGVSYSLSPSLSINTELTLRLSCNDYMDGFRYQETDKRDRYYGFSIGLSYHFMKDKYGCPHL